mmetsp:Transcript_28093/g.39034  ORF Transcript_28093/g.39034 Transcript_28093/m.39034 type:complete len:277 (+) Transcript_28093:855-1685(+)
MCKVYSQEEDFLVCGYSNTNVTIILTERNILIFSAAKEQKRIALEEVSKATAEQVWGLLSNTSKLSLLVAGVAGELTLPMNTKESAFFFARAINIQRRRLTGKHDITLKLESQQYHPNTITLERPILAVHVLEQLSETIPKLSYNFGFEGSVLWVDKGCRAIFSVSFGEKEVKSQSIEDEKAASSMPPIISCLLHNKIFDNSVIAEIYQFLHGNRVDKKSIKDVKASQADILPSSIHMVQSQLASCTSSRVVDIENEEDVPGHLRRIIREMRHRHR